MSFDDTNDVVKAECPQSMYFIFAEGHVFLWNQVRSIAPALFVVGRKLKDFLVVEAMLSDVSKVTRAFL